MNGWSITTVNAAGTGSSEATVISRNSPWMVVNAVTSISSINNYAVQLPVNPEVGDLVEVCVGSTSPLFGYVWYGATVIDSSTTLYEQVSQGITRSYRFISGPRWNRDT